MPFKNQIVTRS